MRVLSVWLVLLAAAALSARATVQPAGNATTVDARNATATALLEIGAVEQAQFAFTLGLGIASTSLRMISAVTKATCDALSRRVATAAASAEAKMYNDVVLPLMQNEMETIHERFKDVGDAADALLNNAGMREEESDALAKAIAVLDSMLPNMDARNREAAAASQSSQPSAVEMTAQQLYRDASKTTDLERSRLVGGLYTTAAGVAIQESGVTGDQVAREVVHLNVEFEKAIEGAQAAIGEVLPEAERLLAKAVGEVTHHHLAEPAAAVGRAAVRVAADSASSVAKSAVGTVLSGTAPVLEFAVAAFPVAGMVVSILSLFKSAYSIYVSITDFRAFKRLVETNLPAFIVRKVLHEMDLNRLRLCRLLRDSVFAAVAQLIQQIELTSFKAKETLNGLVDAMHRLRHLLCSGLDNSGEYGHQGWRVGMHGRAEEVLADVMPDLLVNDEQTSELTSDYFVDAVLTSPPEVSHIEQAASQIAGDGVPVYDVLFSEDFLGMVQSSGGKDGLKNAKQRRVLKTGSTIYLKPGIKMQKKLNAASAKVVGIMTGLGRVAEATAYSIAGAVAPPPPPQREAFRPKDYVRRVMLFLRASRAASLMRGFYSEDEGQHTCSNPAVRAAEAVLRPQRSGSDAAGSAAMCFEQPRQPMQGIRRLELIASPPRNGLVDAQYVLPTKLKMSDKKKATEGILVPVPSMTTLEVAQEEMVSRTGREGVLHKVPIKSVDKVDEASAVCARTSTLTTCPVTTRYRRPAGSELELALRSPAQERARDRAWANKPAETVNMVRLPHNMVNLDDLCDLVKPDKNYDSGERGNVRERLSEVQVTTMYAERGEAWESIVEAMLVRGINDHPVPGFTVDVMPMRDCPQTSAAPKRKSWNPLKKAEAARCLMRSVPAVHEEMARSNEGKSIVSIEVLEAAAARPHLLLKCPSKPIAKGKRKEPFPPKAIRDRPAVRLVDLMMLNDETRRWWKLPTVSTATTAAMIKTGDLERLYKMIAPSLQLYALDQNCIEHWVWGDSPNAAANRAWIREAVAWVRVPRPLVVRSPEASGVKDSTMTSLWTLTLIDLPSSTWPALQAFTGTATPPAVPEEEVARMPDPVVLGATHFTYFEDPVPARLADGASREGLDTLNRKQLSKLTCDGIMPQTPLCLVLLAQEASTTGGDVAVDSPGDDAGVLLQFGGDGESGAASPVVETQAGADTPAVSDTMRTGLLRGSSSSAPMSVDQDQGLEIEGTEERAPVGEGTSRNEPALEEDAVIARDPQIEQLINVMADHEAQMEAREDAEAAEVMEEEETKAVAVAAGRERPTPPDEFVIKQFAREVCDDAADNEDVDWHGCMEGIMEALKGKPGVVEDGELNPEKAGAALRISLEEQLADREAYVWDPESEDEMFEEDAPAPDEGGLTEQGPLGEAPFPLTAQV